ncbi:hypothetical protein ACFX2C_046762 [Malus domestica]
MNGDWVMTGEPEQRPTSSIQKACCHFPLQPTCQLDRRMGDQMLTNPLPLDPTSPNPSSRTLHSSFSKAKDPTLTSTTTSRRPVLLRRTQQEMALNLPTSCPIFAPLLNPETSTTPQNDLSAGSSGGSVSDAKPNASSSGESTAKDPCFPSSSSVTGLEGCNLDWIHAFHLHDSVIGLANDPEAFAELRERRLALLTVAKKLRKRCQSVSPLAVVMQQQCGEGSGGAVKVQWCSSKRDRAVQFCTKLCAVRTAMLCSKETVQGRQGSAASSTGSIDGSAVKMLAVRWVYGGCARWQYNGCAVAVLRGWAQWLCFGF